MEIGSKIRNLRQKMGLTQEELAERSDLTKGFISQMEHGNASPSVDNLYHVVSALGSNLSDFFKEEKKGAVVYRSKDSLSKVYEDQNIIINWLIKDSQKNAMEPVIMELEVKGESKTYKPFEGESFGYVLEGKITLHLGNEVYKLDTGDSFYFEANQKHFIKNNGKNLAKVLWVLSPPNF